MAETTIELGGEEHSFTSKKEMLIQVGKSILEDADGQMTLRQLYYRFVALDLIDNKQSQYQYLGEAIKDARLDGRISWDLIEDRTRSTNAGDHNDGEVVDPESRFNGNYKWFKETVERFHRPRWEGQDNYVEVWVEKEALAGVFANVCDDLKVVSFPNRGYTSITLLKEAADRIREEGIEKGREAYILYFGDFDPSGQDIERNIDEKLSSEFDVPVTVERKALTKKQINQHQLPPQPAKTTDSRYEDFVAKHGNMAVELDALPPDDLKALIHDSVEEYFDNDHYQDNILPKQKEDRKTIRGKLNEVLVDDLD